MAWSAGLGQVSRPLTVDFARVLEKVLFWRTNAELFDVFRSHLRRAGGRRRSADDVTASYAKRDVRAAFLEHLRDVIADGCFTFRATRVQLCRSRDVYKIHLSRT